MLKCIEGPNTTYLDRLFKFQTEVLEYPEAVIQLERVFVFTEEINECVSLLAQIQPAPCQLLQGPCGVLGGGVRGGRDVRKALEPCCSTTSLQFVLGKLIKMSVFVNLCRPPAGSPLVAEAVLHPSGSSPQSTLS